MAESDQKEKVEHHEKKVHHEKNDSINIPIGKLRNNPWIATTFVLLIALIVVIVVFMIRGANGASISEKEAGTKVIDFVNQQVAGRGTAELISTSKEGGLFKSVVRFNGQDIPIYLTFDGQYLVPQVIPLSENGLNSTDSQNPQPTPQEVPKSDKPIVELFVMSYCPYGTQMEKGILPVLGALKDKINFTLRYTHFTLHGEKEDVENYRQLCIREEQGSKFMPYIQCILNSTNVNAPANVSSCMASLGIDESKVNSCMDTKAKDYFASDSKLSEGYGVQGSPTLIINGVESQTSRSPAAVLATICSAFNQEPSECNITLSTDNPSPGFGFNAGSGADSAAANCGF